MLYFFNLFHSFLASVPIKEPFSNNEVKALLQTCTSNMSEDDKVCGNSDQYMYEDSVSFSMVKSNDDAHISETQQRLSPSEVSVPSINNDLNPVPSFVHIQYDFGKDSIILADSRQKFSHDESVLSTNNELNAIYTAHSQNCTVEFQDKVTSTASQQNDVTAPSSSNPLVSTLHSQNCNIDLQNLYISSESKEEHLGAYVPASSENKDQEDGTLYRRKYSKNLIMLFHDFWFTKCTHVLSVGITLVQNHVRKMSYNFFFNF